MLIAVLSSPVFCTPRYGSILPPRDRNFRLWYRGADFRNQAITDEDMDRRHETTLQDPAQSSDRSSELVVIVLRIQGFLTSVLSLWTDLVGQETSVAVQPEDELVEGLGLEPVTTEGLEWILLGRWE